MSPPPQPKPNQGMENTKNELSKCGKIAFNTARKSITNSSSLKQLAIGGVSGWCTGFFATRVGKTVALSIGGSVFLIAAANQAGLVNVNWDKFGKKAGDMATKVGNKMPAIQTNVGKYGKSNTMFAAGFVGGFLLGLCS